MPHIARRVEGRGTPPAPPRPARADFPVPLQHPRAAASRPLSAVPLVRPYLRRTATLSPRRATNSGTQLLSVLLSNHLEQSSHPPAARVSTGTRPVMSSSGDSRGALSAPLPTQNVLQFQVSKRHKNLAERASMFLLPCA